MTTTSDPRNQTAERPAPASIGQPRLELLSPEELRIAYPDPHPSTTGSPQVLARMKQSGHLGPAPKQATPARNDDDDVTNAEPIGKAQDLELP